MTHTINYDDHVQCVRCGKNNRVADIFSCLECGEINRYGQKTVVRSSDEVMLDLVHDIKRALEADGVDVSDIQSTARAAMALCIWKHLPELQEAVWSEHMRSYAGIGSLG